jgi:hypothetical protein
MTEHEHEHELPENVLIMEWVALADLRIPRYQRPERKNIDKLVQGWKTRLAGAIIVSERGGALWVVDGQTRAKAARRLGLTHLPAIILFGLTEEEEAELFLALNRDRLAVSAVARHCAESYAGDQRAIKIDAVLAQNGLIATTSNGRVDGLRPFSAIVSAEKVYDDGGPEILDSTFRILEEALAKDSGRFRGALVAGLGYFLCRDPWEAEADSVTKALSHTTGQKLDELANHWLAIGGGRGTGGGSPIHMARAVAMVVYGQERGPEWKPLKRVR